jgi:hypothetical protein
VLALSVLLDGEIFLVEVDDRAVIAVHDGGCQRDERGLRLEDGRL